MSDLNRVVAGLRCRDVLELLPDYVEGDLSADLLARVEEHLNGCDRCEKFGGEYGELVRVLRSGRSPARVTEDVRGRLMTRLNTVWKNEGTR